jgi:Zn-dependent peptidase ImmA (M78 family)
MAFKLSNTPYKVDNTPIYSVPMEDGVMGKANNNGTIILNKNLSPSECQNVINHEMVHINQMKRGDLDYDDDNVYWKGKKYPRAAMQEGAKNLPWEAEAYKNA